MFAKVMIKTQVCCFLGHTVYKSRKGLR